MKDGFKIKMSTGNRLDILPHFAFDGIEFPADFAFSNELLWAIHQIADIEAGITQKQFALQKLFKSDYAIDNPQLYYNIIKEYIDYYKSLKSTLSLKNEKYKLFSVPIPKENILPNDYELIVQQNDEILEWLEEYIKKYVIDLPINNQPAKSKLEDIFTKPDHYNNCIALLKELEIINPVDAQCLLTTKKGYLLFAVIDAIKTNTDPPLLNRTFTDKELLEIFNSHLNTVFKQVKRDSLGYTQKIKEARRFIRLNVKR